MSQSLHIFRKDLRRGRPFLLLWSAVLLIWLALNWADPLDAQELVEPASLNVVVLIAGLLGVSLVMHEEPTVGTDAFWMSRPIQPAALFTAKAAFVAFFVGLPPIVCQLVLLARFGALPEQLGATLAAFGLTWFALVSIAMAIAAVTPNTPTFVAVSLGAWLTFVTASISLGPEPGRASSPEDSLWATLISCALAVPAGAALTAHQGLTRRTPFTIAAGLATLLTLLVMPAPFSGDRMQRLAEGAAKLDSIRVELVHGPNAERFSATEPRTRNRTPIALWAFSQPEGLPPAHDLELIGLRGEVEWEDTAPTSVFAPSGWFAGDGIRSGAGDHRWLDGHGFPRVAYSLRVSGPGRFRDYLDLSGRVSAQSPARLWKIEPAEGLALEPGASASGPGWTAKVMRADPLEDRLSVVLRLRRVEASLWPSAAPVLLLVNARRGEMLASPRVDWRDGYSFGSLFGGAHVRVEQSEYRFPRVVRPLSPDPVVVDEAWLNGAELVLLHYDPAGRLTAQVEIPELRLEPQHRPGPPVVSDLR